MRTLIAVVGALCVSACPLFAQSQPQPAVATESVAAVGADSVEVVDRKLETYFRDKFAHARPGVMFKRLHRTPAEGVFVAELQNDWLTHTFRIRSADEAEGTDAPAVSAEAVEAAVSEFGKLKPVDASRLAATLRGLGTTLAEVYRPATGPYFNNGRGLVFDRKQRRYFLVARGVRDLAANQCFKAAIDVATGDVVSNASVPCAVE